MIHIFSPSHICLWQKSIFWVILGKVLIRSNGMNCTSHPFQIYASFTQNIPRFFFLNHDYYVLVYFQLISASLCHAPSFFLLFSAFQVLVCSVTQSCPAPCDPIDCSPPGSSVYGIFQARILEQVAISYSRGSSQLKD